MSEYIAGTTVRITLTFRDYNGNLVDPTTSVTAYVMDPAGTVADYIYLTDSEITKSSTGVYVLLYPTAVTATAGRYTYGGRGIGTYDVTAQGGAFTLLDWTFD